MIYRSDTPRIRTCEQPGLLHLQPLHIGADNANDGDDDDDGGDEYEGDGERDWFLGYAAKEPYPI
jgi:hypothetical protein